MTAAETRSAIDPTRLDAWIQVLPDNTVQIRTGVSDHGQGSGAAWRQIVADELGVPYAAVREMRVVDTDEAPDGSIATGYISRDLQLALRAGVGVHHGSPFGGGALNLQKVAAYLRAELLERAASRLGAAVDELTVVDGVVRHGARTVRYADLVSDAPLETRLELSGSMATGGLVVMGEPPLVPRTEWKVIGTPTPNPRIEAVVRGTTRWVGDVTLPGMLHGRVVHPRTLGSTLVSVGQLPAGRFPTTQVIVRGNLVGVVADDEWEAVRAAEALAEATTWSDWQGLPGSDDLVNALVEADWSVAPERATGDRSAVDAALAAAPRRLDAVYFTPYFKHAPMGPDIAVADVRDDGSVHVWAFTQLPQLMGSKIATMLSIDASRVVVHFADGAAGFGRTNRGDAGAESEAVLLSQACGRPVRVQWSRADEFGWSPQQPAYLGTVSAGLDDDGRLVALLAEHHQPGVNDGGPLGALLTGLPTQEMPPEYRYLTMLWVEWPYDAVSDHAEIGRGAPSFGPDTAPNRIGLRQRAVRTPYHLQQNFGVESMVNEAAAAAGADPIQFRLDHTTDPRLTRVLETVRRMSNWEARPSPAPGARAAGGGIVRGRGVGVGIRHGTYLAGVAEIAVDLDDGRVTVERYWVAIDPGVVVNPRTVLLNVEGGTVMGISQTLLEEVGFDHSAVTSIDYRSYPILTMAETPEIVVEVIQDRDAPSTGQAAEPPNMVPPVAISGAFLDATGKPMRRLPMRPEYVRAELREA